MGTESLAEKIEMILENESGEVSEQVELSIKYPFSSPSETIEFFVDTGEGKARFVLDRYQTASFIRLLSAALAEALIDF